MKLQIVSRTGSIWEGNATEVVVPAHDGEIGILAGHTPLLALLVPGTVRFVTESGAKRIFEVTTGVVTVEDDEIVIVVDAGSEAGSVQSA